jgi:hypothetical protein
MINNGTNRKERLKSLLIFRFFLYHRAIYCQTAGSFKTGVDSGREAQELYEKLEKKWIYQKDESTKVWKAKDYFSYESSRVDEVVVFVVCRNDKKVETEN